MENNLLCRHCSTPCPPELEELPCQSCGADSLFRFVPEGTPRNYREICNALGLKDRDIAVFFGYRGKLPGPLTSSTAFPRIKAGVENVFYAALFNRG